MRFETQFNCGDKGWAWNGNVVHEVTIGQIRINHTDSTGLNKGVVEPGCGVAFDNYKPQKNYEESYMCIETGIGGGSVYTYGEHIFKTREECEKANAARIAEREREANELRAYKERALLAEEASLRSRLEQIDALKARAAA